jgi:hypothetical protein
MAKARRGRRRSPGGAEDRRGVVRDHWRADGRPKVRFATEADANRESLRLRLEEGADLDPYPCSFCGDWHLGGRPG